MLLLAAEATIATRLMSTGSTAWFTSTRSTKFVAAEIAQSRTVAVNGSRSVNGTRMFMLVPSYHDSAMSLSISSQLKAFVLIMEVAFALCMKFSRDVPKALGVALIRR